MRLVAARGGPGTRELLEEIARSARETHECVAAAEEALDRDALATDREPRLPEQREVARAALDGSIPNIPSRGALP